MKKYISLIALIVIILFSCDNKKYKTNDFIYSFENTDYNGVYTPISKFKINNSYKYFIIDTGANMSMIDETYYEGHKDDFKFIKELDMTLSGVSGDKDVKSKYIIAEIGDSIKISHSFITSNLSGVIYNIKSSCGYDIIGIIGADYLNRYDICVDFKNDIAYRSFLNKDSIITKSSI